jgi:hypothetical protein
VEFLRVEPTMGMSLVAAFLVATGSAGATIPEAVVDAQNESYRRYWGVHFNWKFDDLPAKGGVPKYRVPFSGYIYPDTNGGTAEALSKYDDAFHDGRMSATSHENWDTTAFKERTELAGPLGGILGLTRMETPHWHGHCNGWTAATIRHAEPQKEVTVNGVEFTPTDIKALLAEIYLYNDNRNLAGGDRAINAGTFHAVIANWLGRGAHPLGMESDPSDEKWNYPIYAYATSSAKRSDGEVEVKLNLAYVKDSDREYTKSPRIQQIKYFHYGLKLNEEGEIVGGRFYRDSSIIDLLWVPLRPKPSGRPGHEMGNPHVDVDRVLSIWRASVPEEERRRWFVVDPPPEDRITGQGLIWGRGLVPVQQPPQAEAAARTTDRRTRMANWGARPAE